MKGAITKMKKARKTKIYRTFRLPSFAGGLPALAITVMLAATLLFGVGGTKLAERSGLPQSTISSWYKKSMTPSFASLEKICDAFGVTLSQFFAQDDICVALTPAQREMLDKWNCLTSVQQAALAALMDTMI